MEETATFKEILDFEIKKIEDQKLQEVLLEILKLSLPARREGFEYVVLVNPSSWVEIRYLQDRKSSDPFNTGEKQKIGREIGLFMTSFWGNAIKPDDVQKYIKDCLSGAWIEQADTAIKEISNMCFARP
jgi:hypothetical protein